MNLLANCSGLCATSARRFMWCRYIKRRIQSIGVKCTPELSDCLKHIYNYYDKHLQSTHNFDHVYKTFRFGLHLFEELESSYFWNLTECFRLTYCFALLTYDMHLPDWRARESRDMYPTVGIDIAHLFGLNIDRHFYSSLVRSVHLEPAHISKIRDGLLHLDRILILSMKIADHHYMFTPWKIHKKLIEVRFQEVLKNECNFPNFVITYSKYYIQPLLMNMRNKRPRLGQSLLQSYEKNVCAWENKLNTQSI